MSAATALNDNKGLTATLPKPPEQSPKSHASPIHQSAAQQQASKAPPLASNHEVKKSFFGKLKDLVARVVNAIGNFFKAIGAFFKRIFCGKPAPTKPQTKPAEKPTPAARPEAAPKPAAQGQPQAKPVEKPAVSAESKIARISEVKSRISTVFEELDQEQIKEVKALALLGALQCFFEAKEEDPMREGIDIMIISWMRARIEIKIRGSQKRDFEEIFPKLQPFEKGDKNEVLLTLEALQDWRHETLVGASCYSKKLPAGLFVFYDGRKSPSGVFYIGFLENKETGFVSIRAETDPKDALTVIRSQLGNENLYLSRVKYVENPEESISSKAEKPAPAPIKSKQPELEVFCGSISNQIEGLDEWEVRSLESRIACFLFQEVWGMLREGVSLTDESAKKLLQLSVKEESDEFLHLRSSEKRESIPLNLETLQTFLFNATEDVSGALCGEEPRRSRELFLLFDKKNNTVYIISGQMRGSDSNLCEPFIKKVPANPQEVLKEIQLQFSGSSGSIHLAPWNYVENFEESEEEKVESGSESEIREQEDPGPILELLSPGPEEKPAPQKEGLFFALYRGVEGRGYFNAPVNDGTLSVICALNGLSYLEGAIQRGLTLTQGNAGAFIDGVLENAFKRTEDTKAGFHFSTILREEFPQFEVREGDYTIQSLPVPGQITRFIWQIDGNLPYYFGFLDMRDEDHPIGYLGFGGEEPVFTRLYGVEHRAAIKVQSVEKTIEFLEKMKKEARSLILSPLEKRERKSS